MNRGRRRVDPSYHAFSNVLETLKKGAPYHIVQGSFGIYMAFESTYRGALNTGLYAAQLARNGEWIREFSKRGAVDTNTRQTPTLKELNRY